MLTALSDAQVVGFALVVLGAMLAVGWLIRRWVGFLRALFIPASVIAGFAVLLLGEQVLGALTGTAGLFPERVTDVWRVVPGLMINVVFAGIMIGKSLPSTRELWTAARPHFLLGSFLSFGQFALGGLAVLLLLGPVFGLPEEAGSLLEMSFAGGHGTIAGMGGLLVDAGAGELVDIGLGLATISMVTGVVIGSALVRWAVSHPSIPLMRNAPLKASEDYDVDHIFTAPEPTDDEGIHPTVVAFAAIALALGVAIALLWGLRWATGLVGLTLFDKLPLFPVAVIGGFVVQLAANRTGLADHIDRRAIEGISALALDALLVCAIGTMSLATIGPNVPAIVTFTVIGVGWSVVTLLWWGRRFHREHWFEHAIVTFTVIGVGWSVVTLLWWGRRFHREHWFEHAIADFGQSQGNVATGFVLAAMTDPQRLTSTATDYGYKQLPYEPILGGGLITALSVPVITQVGLMPFTVASVALTALLGWLGMRRRPDAVRHG